MNLSDWSAGVGAFGGTLGLIAGAFALLDRDNRRRLGPGRELEPHLHSADETFGDAISNGGQITTGTAYAQTWRDRQRQLEQLRDSLSDRQLRKHVTAVIHELEEVSKNARPGNPQSDWTSTEDAYQAQSIRQRDAADRGHAAVAQARKRLARLTRRAA